MYIGSCAINTIGSQAFYGCPIVEISFSKDVSYIGQEAFGGNPLLKAVFLHINQIPTVGHYIFGKRSELSSDFWINIYSCMIDELRAAENWSYYAEYQDIDGTVYPDCFSPM